MSSQGLSMCCFILVLLQSSFAEDVSECRQDVKSKIFATDDNQLNMLQMHASYGPDLKKEPDAAVRFRDGAVEGFEPDLQEEEGATVILDDVDLRPGHIRDSEPFCRELTDKGAYHTVVVEVGSPPQEFNLVADTGANTLILPDCKCIQTGSCSGITKCFEPHQSSTFGVKMVEVAGKQIAEPATLYFGSGPINCTLASDQVSVGSARGEMNESIFLMEERNSLQVTSSFEGLLGLGQPRNMDLDVADTMKKDLFMRKAGVDRFSICFNADAMGIFRMKVPALSNPMGSIGDLHWAFDLQGMSVGNTTAENVLFCNPQSKKSYQKTACNAVPDSGTTMMLGPKDQILMLFESVCERWPRCMKYSEEHKEMPKSHAFQNLLSKCRDWMSETDGIDEIPPINLHLAGADGIQQVFPLSAWAWVVETTHPVYVFIQQSIFHEDLAMVHPKANTSNYCSTMFSSHYQDTTVNGPQWLFGSSLFYEKVVHFDIGSVPPQMSISDSPCTACEGQPSLLSESSATDHPPRRRAGRALRRLTDFPRMPHWDVTEHL